MSHKAITIWEAFDSRETHEAQTRSRIVRRYVITGTDSDIEAKEELRDFVPDSYDGLPYDSLKVKPLGPEVWEGEVEYVDPDSQARSKQRQPDIPETGDSEFSLEIGTETVRTYIAFEEVYYSADPDPEDTDIAADKLIGVTKNGLEGVDVPVPVISYRETHWVPLKFFSQAYLRLVAELTGKVNSKPWRGFQAGELRFMGVRENARSSKGDVQAQYEFHVSLNRVNFKVGQINVPKKEGWQYLWVKWREEQKGNIVVPVPRTVFVADVHEKADFRLLGIGS